MAGGRRGLVAPQNTFLENIVRRSNGKRCIRVSVTRAFHPAFIADAGRCRQQMQQSPGLCWERGRAPGSLPGAGKVGRAGGVRWTPSQEERSPGGAFLVSSPGSMRADEQSPGKSDGKLGAAGAAARSPSVQPTPPRRLAGRPAAAPRGAASPRGSFGRLRLSPRQPKVRGVGTRGLRDVPQAARFHLLPEPPTHLEIKRRPRGAELPRLGWDVEGTGAALAKWSQVRICHSFSQHNSVLCP